MAYSEQQSEQQVVDIARSIFSHNNLYLIGTAERGAVNIPIQVHNLKQAERYFGSSGTLIDAMKQLEGIPKRQEIYLIKTTGSHSVCYLNLNDFGSSVQRNAFMVRSVHAYELGNEIEVLVEADSVTVIPPASAGLPTLTYRYDVYPTIGQLIDAINADAKDGVSLVEAQCSLGEHFLSQMALSVCNTRRHRLAGGDSGLKTTKNRLYYALSDTYSVLEGLNVDIVMPLGVAIDDIQLSSKGATSFNNRDKLTLTHGARVLTYYDQLLEYCQRQLSSGIFTHGVMGFNSSSDKPLSSWVGAWTKTKKNSLYFSTYAYLISIVAGDLHYNYYQHQDSAALAYASLISGLAVESCPYNQPFTDAIQLVQVFTKSEFQTLNKLGFVTFRNSLFHRSVVAHHDGTPYVDDELGLRYFHNIRMCQIVAKAVRQTVDQYIGENLTSLLKYSSLERSIENLLTFFNNRGLIRDSRFEIQADQVLGAVTIKLSLKAKHMIEWVEIVGQIQTEGEGK